MLATAIHAQPGVYALLLGSGISTGASIPTGWGVVTNLIERLATAADPTDTASQELAATDPGQWWADNGDGDLGYSTLLAALATTPSARQGLLHNYFVATDDERDQGIKIPSPAHHAIAALVKRGSVKVILTTNFDRLLEQALDAAGVSTQVITRPEAVAGMTPLSHAPATIIKLHGDYEELDSRNTIDELTTYPEQWNELLERIFTEYGLLIVDGRVIPQGVRHGFPHVWVCWVERSCEDWSAVFRCPSGAFAWSVGGAVHEDLVAGVDESVEQ